jgi:hypothetical protein
MTEIPEDFVDNSAENFFLPFCNIPPRLHRHLRRNRRRLAQQHLTLRRRGHSDSPPVFSIPRTRDQSLFLQPVQHPTHTRYVQSIQRRQLRRRVRFAPHAIHQNTALAAR